MNEAMITKVINCAIYTRKSHEDGLEQEFNSLHAQEESCKAYILSQAHANWQFYKSYEDAAISGGTLQRPALQELIKDIEEGKIGCVVVYKVDRLSRSLFDFSKLIELFEKHNVSFVSITQSFNTANAMGKLMLNVLLSFAQFEREVTAERIRDKIKASKKKGIFMGGCPPLGYKIVNRKLIIIEDEARLVEAIYRKYLELNSLQEVKDYLNDKGINTKKWTSQIGKEIGGNRWSNATLSRLLQNPLYVGKISYQGEVYDGEHKAIIKQSLFNQV